MVWGLFPGVYKNVSWESHMLGFFSGLLLAVVYRNQGPQKPVYEWMDEEEEETGGEEEGENGGTEVGGEETKGRSDSETE
jgi:hypothetical protein